MVIIRSASSRETACSGPMTRPVSVLRVIAVYIVRNGLYGLSDVSGSRPCMWSELIATLTPARSQSPRPMKCFSRRAAQGVGERVAVLVVPGRLGIDAHAERGGPADGVGVGEVGVDERVAAVLDRPVAVRGLDGVEHQVHARVAGDVRAHLPAEPVAGADHGLRPSPAERLSVPR